jgi:hypothetical protein
VYSVSSLAIGHLRGRRRLLDREVAVEHLRVGRAVVDAVDPRVEPLLEALGVAGRLGVFEIEVVVAVVSARERCRVRTGRRFDDGIDLLTRDARPTRVALDDRGVDNLTCFAARTPS